MRLPVVSLCRYSLILWIASTTIAFVLTGCLTAQRKVLTFTLNADGSGKGRIVFENIMSMDDENGVDASARDYGELINTFLHGTRFQEMNPELENMQKRLYEKDDVLYGEVTFDFLSYMSVGLYRHQGDGPYMYHIGRQSDIAWERYASSNGVEGGARMPVVFWPAGTTEFSITASIQDPDVDTRTLLPLFRRFGTSVDKQ